MKMKILQKNIKKVLFDVKALLKQGKFWKLQGLNLLTVAERVLLYSTIVLGTLLFMALVLAMKPFNHVEMKAAVLNLMWLVLLLLFIWSVLFPLVIFMATNGEKGKFFTSKWFLYLMFALGIGFLNRRITITLIDSLNNWAGSCFIIFVGVFFLRKGLYLAAFHKIDEQEEFKKWQPYISKAISIQEEVQSFEYMFKGNPFRSENWIESGYQTGTQRKTKIKFKYSNIWIERNWDQGRSTALQDFKKPDWPLRKFKRTGSVKITNSSSRFKSKLKKLGKTNEK